MSEPADRNLLLGVLALQLDFVTREQLVAVVTSWLLEKQTPIGVLLVRQRALTGERRQLLEALVDEHLRQHGGQVVQSLAALSSLDAVKDELHRLGDANLSASLVYIAGSVTAPKGGQSGVDLSSTLSHPDPVTSSGQSAGGRASAERRFRILRPHAEGGLGVVSVARDKELNREVALKEIKPKFSTDATSRNRFTLEAEITGGLEHPGIVPVYGLGQYDDGRPYYAMRFIRGDSLKEAIERFHVAPPGTGARPEPGPVDPISTTVVGTEPPSETHRTDESITHRVSSEAFGSVEFRKLLGRFIDVCQAIQYAHSRGVLHRDLKPGNIMLGKHGETLVVDWGLAKAAGKSERFESSGEVTLVPSSGSSVEATRAGSVIGTPAYMSPEQGAGRLDQLGPATDVYSLGATLYHVLTGRAPFVRQSLPEVLALVQRGEFPRPREFNPHVPRPLESICLKAMSLRPEDRYAAAADIADDIERWLADEPVHAHRETTLSHAARWFRKHRAWAMSGAAALAVVAVVATVSALWINWQKEVIATQERAATQLANRNAALAEEKSKLADEKTALARLEQSAREKADRNADAALQQTKLAKRNLYIAHMNLAQAGWDDARVGQTTRLLDLYRPAAGEHGGPDDLRGFEWHFWDHMCHGEQLELKEHNGPVMSMAWSADGKRIASAGRVLKVWDATTGQETFTLKGHAGAGIDGVAFSADGNRLASAGHDQTVKVWDATSGQEMLTLKGHTSSVTSVAWSADGTQLASASYDQTVRVWDSRSGQETHLLKGHTANVFSIAFSPDGTRLASASRDQTVKLWDTANGQENLTLKGHTHWVRSVAWSADGKRLASAGDDKMVKLWDAKSGREIRTLRGHTRNVNCVAFSVDGMRLASGGHDHTVKVWDVATGQELMTLKGHTLWISEVAFSADGNLLASASWDGTVKVWDTRNDQNGHALKGHTSGVSSIAWSADGNRLASAGEDQTVKVWDAASGQEMLTLKGHTASVSSVAWSPAGSRLASSGDDQTVKVWDATSGQETLTLKGHTGRVASVAFSPDGKRLASASYDQTVKVWDAVSGREIVTLKGHTFWVSGVAWNVDGKQLASASYDKTVKVWDTATGREIVTLKGHTSAVNSVAWSGDGARLASASLDQAVKVWDAASGRETLTLKGNTAVVVSVAWSADGKRLASAGEDQGVRVWDATSGQEMLTLKGNTNFVFSVAWNADGKRLASTNGDQTVKVWDARPWTPELRAEREAVTIVRTLFANPLNVKKHCLEAIRNDATIREEVRQKALELAERVHLEEIVDSKAWFYAANGGGVFIKTRTGWVERNARTPRFDFVEINHTDKVVELLDRSRNISVRLHDDHCELSTNQKDWTRLYEGEWR